MRTALLAGNIYAMFVYNKLNFAFFFIHIIAVLIVTFVVTINLSL